MDRPSDIELVRRLRDLHTQATKERSHYYVGNLATDAADAIEALTAALVECSDDLEEELNARYPAEVRKYPTMQRDYDHDMAAVLRARAALRKVRP